MANPKSAAWYGGGLGMFLLPGANWEDNSLFYIDDTDGDDGNDGLTPMAAFESLTHALTQAVAAPAINYFIVLRYGNDPTLDATWPISIDVANAQLIAASTGMYMPNVDLDADGNFGCLSIDAGGVRVQGFRLQPGAQPAITFTNAVGRVGIFDCLFEGGTYGIYSPGGGVSFALEIARNWFGGGLTAGGIYLADDPGLVRIKENYFNIYAGGGQVGIRIESGANAEILDNRFNVHETVTAGYAIYLEAMVHRALIVGNHAATVSVVPPVNPYRDLAIGATAFNAWGLNYMGLTPTYPVLI